MRLFSNIRSIVLDTIAFARRNVSMILRHKVSAFSELPLVFRGA